MRRVLLSIIEKWQKIVYEQYGIHFIHASDEFYILADGTLPETERYDGYIRSWKTVWECCGFWTEVTRSAGDAAGGSDEGKREICSIATGRLAYPYLRRQP